MRYLMPTLMLLICAFPLLTTACRGPERTPKTDVREVDTPSSRPENNQPSEAERKRDEDR